jgi:hypothetical protein
MTEEFVYTIRPKVSSLIIKWDLYWVLEEDAEEYTQKLWEANGKLTTAAISALESANKQIWYDTADKFSNLGAYDTEPRAQFEYLWRQVYGEDE